MGRKGGTYNDSRPIEQMRKRIGKNEYQGRNRKVVNEQRELAQHRRHVASDASSSMVQVMMGVLVFAAVIGTVYAVLAYYVGVELTPSGQKPITAF